MTHRVNVSYLKQDLYVLTNLLSFCDPKDLPSAKLVNAYWHQASERLEAQSRTREVGARNACWQPETRHPLYGICLLIDKIRAGEPVNSREIEKRLLFISVIFRRKILHALSLAEGGSFSSREAAYHPFKLEKAIQKVVAKQFADLGSPVQKRVAYKIWKYAGGIREDELGRKIDPYAFGMKHAKENTPFLIRALNDVVKLDYPRLLCPKSVNANYLLRNIVRTLNRMDEDDKFLIDCWGQARIVLNMLESLPSDLRQKLVVFSSDNTCLIPYDAAYQVLNVCFTFSYTQQNHVLQSCQGALPRGVVDFNNEDFVVAQMMIPPQSCLFETETSYKRRFEKLLIETFHQCFQRNKTLPHCHLFLKQTMLFYTLIRYQLIGEQPTSLFLLLQNLAFPWKQQGVDVLEDLFRAIHRLSRHPKQKITASNCFDNFKYFKMALALTVDGLFYRTRAPKIAIALELLSLLDGCLYQNGFMTSAQKEIIENKIYVLQRLCKAPKIYENVGKYMLEKGPHRVDKHIFKDLSILRKAVEDTLYSLLILEESGYTYVV